MCVCTRACAHLRRHTHVPPCLCGGQKAPCGSQFFHSTIWISGIELGITSLCSEHCYLQSCLPSPWQWFLTFHRFANWQSNENIWVLSYKVHKSHKHWLLHSSLGKLRSTLASLRGEHLCLCLCHKHLPLTTNSFVSKKNFVACPPSSLGDGHRKITWTQGLWANASNYWKMPSP